jgi:Bax protein
MAPHAASLARTLTFGTVAAVAVVLLAIGLELIDDSANIAGLPPLSPQITYAERITIADPRKLTRLFDKTGYRLASVRTGKTAVPRMMVRELPDGIEKLEDTDARKRLFIRTVLPLILRVNAYIADHRRTLQAFLDKQRSGTPLTRREARWLSHIAAHYRTGPDKIATLRRRIAPVPPSLAIAQAAIETGWGSSRFAQDGNALFGQWTFTQGEGLKPRDAASDSRHAVKSYDRLVGSAWDYARNLNSNAAYRALRDARARGEQTGLQLAEYLGRYSERGRAYVDLLRDIIRQNDLAPLDTAKLDDQVAD